MMASWMYKMSEVVLVVVLVVVVWSDGCCAKDDGMGQWGEWSAMSACSVTCGSGSMKIQRRWIPGPKSPPSKDPYISSRVFSCTNKDVPNCPMHGLWSGWMAWSVCTKACGQGTKNRTRECIGRRYNGKPCGGKFDQVEPCNKEPCPVLPRNFQMSQCTKKNFTCASGKMCVLGSNKCDGQVECHDGSDEIGCPRINRGTGSIRYDLSREGHASTLQVSTALQYLMLVVVLAFSANVVAMTL